MGLGVLLWGCDLGLALGNSGQKHLSVCTTDCRPAVDKSCDDFSSSGAEHEHMQRGVP